MDIDDPRLLDPSVLVVVNKVVAKLPPEGKTLGIVALLQIAVLLVELFRACYQLQDDPASGVDIVRHPKLHHLLRLRRLAHRFINDFNDRRLIVNAVLGAGEDATADDIKALVGASLPRAT